MKVEDVRKLSAEARFLYWVKERHAIYLRRKAKRPKPWTDDAVLQSVFFTNPYREHDKVTTWLRDNVREPWRNDPCVLFAVVCFRWFNWIPTGQLLRDAGLLEHWDLNQAVGMLEGYRDSGYQVFTGAFNISNSGSTKPKINRVCEDYIQPFHNEVDHLLTRWWANGVDESPTLEGAHDCLKTFPGLGGSGFMAAQVVCDLKYTYLLEGATDWWTWCCRGPGSVRGLNILLGHDTEDPAPKNFVSEINRLRELIGRELPELPPLHAQDVQNCCCEYFKYNRALHGGRSKRGYNGGY